MFKIKINLNDFSNRKSFRNNTLTNDIVIKKGDCYKVLKIKKGNFSFEATNIMLLQLLVLTLKKALQNVHRRVNLEYLLCFLFNRFKAAYFKTFVQKYLKKEIIGLNHLYMLSINKFKFDKFLPGLKLLIGKLYNKKVVLNLVNLKYLHLNSDVFAESVSIKLRKKTNSLLRVLKSGLKLVKIPTKLNPNNVMVNANMINNSSQKDLDQNVLFKERLNVFLDKIHLKGKTLPRFVSRLFSEDSQKNLTLSSFKNVSKTIDLNNSLNLLPVGLKMKTTL